MTYKINIPVTSRDFYFTPAGDDAWSAASPETAVTTPNEAIVRVNALSPPPSIFFPSSVNASQTGVSLDGVVMPTSTSASCEFAAIVVDTDTIALTLDDNQTARWGAVVSRVDSGVNMGAP